MNRNTTKTIARVIAVVLVAALVITTFTFVFTWADSGDDISWDKELKFLKDLIIQTKTDYKDHVTYESLFSGAFQGVINSLQDPYSVFYPSQEDGDKFEESISGEFYGIGVNLEYLRDQVVVVSPIPGGPAEKAGILSGDVITGVDGKDIRALGLEEVANLLRGKAATKLVITIDRQGTLLDFTLVRQMIKITSVDFKMLDNKIGYIVISQFSKDTHKEFDKAKKQLVAQGAKSFIIDVRNNSGGYVDVAVDIAQQFMPKGPIVHFEQKGRTVETINAKGPGDLTRPVVLLVNEGSASASEILAAAWQDSKTAKLVGTATYGKGVAQQIYTFPNGRKMKLSTFYFLGPDKKTINGVGVKPDYFVKSQSLASGAADKDKLEKYQTFAPMSEASKPRVGDLGLNVYGAQQRLALLGYKQALSGKMDQTMFNHVKNFQRQAGLYPYGVLDYTTMASLDKAARDYVMGTSDGKDLQLEKAIELLK